MKKAGFGSLFEKVFNKSPDAAKKLLDIAKQGRNQSRADMRTKPAISKEVQPARSLEKRATTDSAHGDKIESKKTLRKVQSDSIGLKPAKNLTASILKSKDSADHAGLSQVPSAHPDRFFENIPENADQFGKGDGSKIIDVIIGLDFGTSSTKVVVHAPNFVGSPAFAVPFGKYAHKSLEYLLPTTLSVRSDGTCSLQRKKSSSIFTDIKINLMRSPTANLSAVGEISSSATPTAITAAYLALVLRYVRSWFLANQEKIFRGFTINWAVNLGLPAAIDDDQKLRDTFDLVGMAAWLLSRKEGPITLKNAYHSVENWRHSRSDEGELPWDFNLVPEVIAEVTGYARSELRNEGLHFLVDVGASTLDVCAFTLREKEGDDHFHIYTAEVVLLGAQRLHQARIDGVQKAISEVTQKIFDIRDPLGLIPNDLRTYAPDNAIVIEKVDEANNAFSKDASYAIHKTIWHTRKRRDPHSPRWAEPLPVFVCGGAREINLYQQVIQGVEGWVRRFIPSCPGIRIIPLPKPKSFEANIKDSDYHRLAVAWGLSHEIFNIGNYDRPSEIDDIEPPRRVDITDRYVGPEMT